MLDFEKAGSRIEPGQETFSTTVSALLTSVSFTNAAYVASVTWPSHRSSMVERFPDAAVLPRGFDLVTVLSVI
jgi:hypothetical protein